MAVNLPKLALPRGVCGFITQFLELSPDIAASSGNVGELLAHLEQEKRVVVDDGPPPAPGRHPARTEFIYERRKKQNRLLVRVHPALVVHEDYLDQHPVFERRYDATAAGMLSAIVDSKAALASLRRGFCETCLALERPRKRLKGNGLPACPECVLAVALGSRADA